MTSDLLASARVVGVIVGPIAAASDAKRVAPLPSADLEPAFTALHA